MSRLNALTREEAAVRERWVSLAAGIGLAVVLSAMLVVPIAHETQGAIARQYRGDDQARSLTALVFHNMNR